MQLVYTRSDPQKTKPRNDPSRFHYHWGQVVEQSKALSLGPRCPGFRSHHRQDFCHFLVQHWEPKAIFEKQKHKKNKIFQKMEA